MNRKFNQNYLNYRHFNNFKIKKNNGIKKINSFDLVSFALKKNNFIEDKNVYTNNFLFEKKLFLNKKSIIKYIPVIKLQKNVLYKVLKNNKLFCNFFMLNHKQLNFSKANSFLKVNVFYKDLVDLKFKFKSFTRKRFKFKKFYIIHKSHKDFFKFSVKFKTYFNYMLLNQHVGKKNSFSHLIKFFFFIKNFSVLKMNKKNNSLKKITLFFSKNAFKNPRFTRYSNYWFNIMHKPINNYTFRSVFNSIARFAIISNNRYNKQTSFRLKTKKKLIRNLNNFKFLTITNVLNSKLFLKKKLSRKRRKAYSFLRLFTINFFVSKRKYTRFLNNRFNFIKLNSKISYLFPKKAILKKIKKRKPDSLKIGVITTKSFVDKPLLKEKKIVNSLMASSKLRKTTSFIYLNNKVTFNTILSTNLKNHGIKKNFLTIPVTKKTSFIKLVKKRFSKIVNFKYNNPKNIFNLFLNERYYYFLIIRYNLPYLNKIISKITSNSNIKWEIFITKRKNINAQDIGTFLKKSLKKRRHQRQLLNPVDLIKNQLGDNLVYLNKIKRIKQNIIQSNLMSLYKDKKIFFKDINSFSLIDNFFMKLNQIIWNFQFKFLDLKLTSNNLLNSHVKDSIINDSNKFFISKLNTVKKKKNYLLTKNPIFFDNISYFYKNNLESTCKSSLIRQKNLLNNNLQNSFIDLLGYLKKSNKFFCKKDSFTSKINSIDANTINKQFIHIVKGFEIVGFGRLGSSSKSTRSNVTTYKIGKTMKNSFDLNIDYDFKTQITRNGIYGLKVSKFYETFDIKKFISTYFNSYLS